MSDVAIRARNLSKVYRLYTRPHYRTLDILGLLRSAEGKYTEHAALDGISLEIRKGEKIGIIGRNGAGKSTFLKLVTRVIEPTSGVLEINGATQALLQIGTGFHNDFTGRQNALSYLAHLGILGSRAKAMLDEIISFAELEEYIDQPLKTYSTGMAMRLMFAASTIVEPDLFVIDEVLGVGDAYFQRKSFERLQELCSGRETTLLLVTHDIYSASKLCDRMIWLDRGRIVADADSVTVVKAYENAIREQEESRLRQKVKLHFERRDPKTRSLIVEFRSPQNRPQPSPIYFASVELVLAGRTIAALPLGDDDQSAAGKLILDHGCWGSPEIREGRVVRPMQNFGSPYHKVSGVFLLPHEIDWIDDRLELVVEYNSIDQFDLEVTIHCDGRSRSLGALPSEPGQWMSFRSSISAKAGSATVSETLAAAERHGSGRVVIASIRSYGSKDEPTLHLEHGRPARFEIDYVINDPALDEHCEVVLAFHRDGVDDIARLIARNLRFNARARPRGTVVAAFERFPLGTAEYTVTVLIAKEGYYSSNPVQFYSVNPDVYACHPKMLTIKVVDGGVIGTGTGAVLDASWKLHAVSSCPSEMVS